MCRQGCAMAFVEHKPATAVGSQQRMRGRHQARRGPADCKKGVRYESGKPIKQRYNCSTSGEADTSGDDIFCGRLGSGLSVGPVFWVARKTDWFGSETDVPLTTAYNRALQRPRLSPLKASGSRRLAKTAPRQVIRGLHAGDERATSSEGPKPPLLSRTRQHDTRAIIPARASCWSQRTTARAGGHREPTPPRSETGKFRELCFSGKRRHQCKKQGPPTLMSRELPCTIATKAARRSGTTANTSLRARW